MEQTKKNDLFTNVILHWGVVNQLKMVYEEIGELLQALNKLDRLTPGGEPFGNWPQKHHSVKYCLAYWNVCSEIADLGIMNDQLKMIFNSEGVKISEDRKLDRLEERFLEYAKKHNITPQSFNDDLPF